MPKEQSPGKPTTRRYSPEEKAAAVRMVRTLRAELGTDHGTAYRVARQLGYGVESVRSWVRQADIDDGYAPGVSTVESQRVKDLEQEVRELKRVCSNSALRRLRARISAAASLDTPKAFDSEETASLLFDVDSALSFQPRKDLVAIVHDRNGLRLCGAYANTALAM